MKKVSVILTTYNSAKFIANTIGSILSQEGLKEQFDIEIIVVDDHSTDNTCEIIRQFPVKLITSEKNSGGPNKGRNVGLGLASGDFICHNDHDDLWHPQRMLKILPYLEMAAIVTSGFLVEDLKTNIRTEYRLSNKDPYKYFLPNETFIKKLTKSLQCQHTFLSSIIYRKELKHILFEEHFGKVDFDWILRLFHHQDSIEVNELLYTRKKYGENLSLDEQYRIIDTFYSLMSIQQFYNQYPREVEISHKRIYGTLARYYYYIGKMPLARRYLKRSGFTIKNVLYYLTSYFGAEWVRKNVHIYD